MIIRSPWNRCLFWLPLFWLLALQANAAQDRLLIWKVKTPSTQMYLLGSMHMARSALYPLRPEIMQAFERSENLVVEVDISGQKQLQLQQMMLMRGMYPPGESLRDHLSAETWELLNRRLPASGMPKELVEQMKPGLVASLLTVQHMMILGLSPERGVDSYFLNLAREDKNILELETAEQQIDLLVNVPEGDLFLRQSLSQMDRMNEILEPMEKAWKTGDADALARVVLEDELQKHPEFRPVLERLFDQRNRAMSARLEQYLRQGGSYFVVVGAGHLVGEEGIVSLLRRQGFKPVQI